MAFASDADFDSNVDALCQQTVHALLNACIPTFITTPPPGRSAGQTESFVDLPEQQATTVTDDVAAVQYRLDNSPFDQSKRHPLMLSH